GIAGLHGGDDVGAEGFVEGGHDVATVRAACAGVHSALAERAATRRHDGFMSTTASSTLCACGSGLEFDACCGPILAGAPAPTAEALMRSRYTAYVKRNYKHLEESLSAEQRADFS